MLNLAQRYLTVNFIPPFVFSTIFFVTFLLTSQLFRITRIVTQKNVGIGLVFELMGHIAVSFLPMAVPLSALFATIYTLNKLSEDSEIVAMRAFGTTKFQLFKPFLIVGLFVCLAIFAANRSLIPYSKTQFRNTLIYLTSQGMMAEIKAEQFFTEIPGVTLFAEKVSDEGKRMHNVFIKIKSSSQIEGEQIIMAKKGILVKHSIEDKGIPTLRLNLYDGNILRMSTTGNLEKIIFEKYDFPVVKGRTLDSFITKDAMRTNSELLAEIEKYDEIIKTAQGNVLKDATKDRAKSYLEYWSRFNTPIQCLVFIFLGFCIGIKQGRGKSKNTTLVAMGILILYYVLFFTGVSFSKRGQLTPIVTVFVPSILTMLIASYYYRKLDWAS